MLPLFRCRGWHWRYHVYNSRNRHDETDCLRHVLVFESSFNPSETVLMASWQTCRRFMAAPLTTGSFSQHSILFSKICLVYNTRREQDPYMESAET